MPENGMVKGKEGDPGIEAATRALRVFGRAEAFHAVRAITSAGLAVALQELRDTPGALDALGCKSFSQVCERLGLSLSTGKEILQNLNTFGDEFLSIADDLSLTRAHLRGARSLPKGERPQVVGGKLLLEGKAFDPTKRADLAAIRDIFDGIATAHTRELKKLHRENTEEMRHREGQIKNLARKVEKREEELRAAGFIVDGRGHEAVQLVEMARDHIHQGIVQLNNAQDVARGAAPEFAAQVLSEVIGVLDAAEGKVNTTHARAAAALDKLS